MRGGKAARASFVVASTLTLTPWAAASAQEHAAAAASMPPPIDVTLGVDYRRLHDFGMALGDVTLAVGGREHGNRTAFFAAEFQGGATEQGLTVLDGRAGVRMLWRVGRHLRPGFGIDAGMLSVDRATTTDSAKAPLFGVSGLCAYDVATWAGGQALFAVARVALDVVVAWPWPVLWGPTLGLGFRL
jgi:hypothetical protein